MPDVALNDSAARAAVTVTFSFFPAEYLGRPSHMTLEDWAERVIRMGIIGQADMPPDYRIDKVERVQA